MMLKVLNANKGTDTNLKKLKKPPPPKKSLVNVELNVRQFRFTDAKFRGHYAT